MGWLIALGILTLLAILPLGAIVRYNAEGVNVKVIAGPARILVVPGKKKDPLEEKPKKQKVKKPEKGKDKATSGGKTDAQKKEKGGPITDFLPLVDTALQLLNAFRRKLRIKRLEMKLIMAADDPCDLAVNYGKAWAALGNLMPLIERAFVIKKRDLEVECDFEASETVIIARLDITITLGWLLGIVIWYGVRALKQYLKIQNKRKGGASK